MTLDRVLSKQQPRVISVLSYYLTSLVNLSFCRLDFACSDRIDFGISSIPLIICVVLIYTPKFLPWSERCLRLLHGTSFCGFFWFSAILVLRFFAYAITGHHVFSVFPILLLSLYPFRCVHIALSLWGFYLYIGITSCAYKITQLNGNFNMEYCINWLKIF